MPLIWAGLNLNVPMTQAEQLAGAQWSGWVAAIRADFASRGITVDGGPGVGSYIFTPPGFVDAEVQQTLLHPRVIGGLLDIAISVFTM